MHDYYYGAQASQFSFIRVPTLLFTDDQYKYVSAEAKVLYGILLRRMDLSAKNGWVDEQGRVYIICTISEIMETTFVVFTYEEVNDCQWTMKNRWTRLERFQ